MKGLYKQLESLPIVRKRFRKRGLWLEEPEKTGDNVWVTTAALEKNWQVLKVVVQLMDKRKISVYALEPQAISSINFRDSVYKLLSLMIATFRMFGYVVIIPSR